MSLMKFGRLYNSDAHTILIPCNDQTRDYDFVLKEKVKGVQNVVLDVTNAKKSVQDAL